MSCHGCATKFGVFSKEKSCPGCGFSFCKKCLRVKTVIPNLGDKEQNVCRSCSESFSIEKKDVEKDSRPPPEAFLRRLESLENPARPPITVYHHNTRMEELKTGLTAEDREIAERLEKLKEERKRQRELPTEEDIVRRLAALKGEDAECAVASRLKKKPEIFLPDLRSDEEKTNALIKQLIEEQILAVKHMSREDIIAKRLARLRGEDSSASSLSQSQSDDVDVEAIAGQSEKRQSKPETEDDVGELMKLAKAELDAAQKELKPGSSKCKSSDDLDKESTGSGDSEANAVVQRVMDEVALEDDDDDTELETKDMSNIQDPEELPWCTICNEDASKRCLGCAGDLFCTKCFAEFHDDDDLKDHKTIPYSPANRK